MKKSYIKFTVALFVFLFCFSFSFNVQAVSAPSEPKLVSLIEADNNQVILTWKKVPGAAGYRIFKKEEGGKWITVKTVKGAAVVTCTDKNLTSGKRYYYTVRAYVKDGSKTIWSTYNKSGLKLVAGLSGLKLNKTSLSIDRGKKYTLKLNGTELSPVWKSGNSKIASISSKGVLTAKAVGKIKVSATLEGKKFYCTVTVRPVFRVSASSVSIKAKESTCVIITSEYANEKLSGSVSDPSILSCSWGGWNGNENKLYIDTKKAGSAKITIKSNASGRTLEILVTVK